MEFTKTQIEKAIGDKFFEIYNKYNKSKIAIKRNGEQGKLNEPDLISNNGIGIEIFSNQYSQENKRQIEVNIKLGEPVVSSQVLIDSDQKACEFMLNKIQSKESKSYDFVGDIRLVVDCRDTPLTTMEDFKKFFDYNPIQKSRFKEIRLFNSRARIAKPYQLGESDGGLEVSEGALYDDKYIIYKIF